MPRFGAPAATFTGPAIRSRWQPFFTWESARANGQASTGRQGVVPCYFIPSCTLQNYIRDFVTEEGLFFLFESNCPVCHRSDPFSYMPLNPIRIATAFR
jgi:hypothetical protein